ncbi:MAG: hypothetical protein OHK93_000264 [Ramalina farinacea]|uniref:Uncharacterized protein n=1 Tax=Ramalina farinacea TaxID=258253 RepID=A0AA43TRM5_9LECA|nr:hypothetical protein [Ramalina farinacea]
MDQQHQLPQQPNAADHFKQCLMEHISNLPTQPFSLPPSFITTFVRRAFTEDLCMVDFTQALTAMDYLKDLDNRRKRELTSALQRLGLDKVGAEQQTADRVKNPRIWDWVTSMQEKERKIEALYTQVYIGLRRWTLINEMRLEPFSKANSIAMLNTLYPPSNVVPPTRQLTASILNQQRKAFFRYITAVENNGKEILKNLEHQGQREGDSNGWPVVRDIVDKYLRTANGIIEESLEIDGPQYFSPEAESARRNERRADSGRPNERSTPASQQQTPPHLPPSLNKSNTAPSSTTNNPPTPKKRGTTLEKIAREFRNLRNRNDVKELAHRNDIRTTTNDLDHTATTRDITKSKSLRKMKSTSSIGKDHGKPRHSRSPSDEPMPDIDMDERRRQMIAEARREKEKRALQQRDNGGVSTAAAAPSVGRSFG